jgi:hypothetical protein
MTEYGRTPATLDNESSRTSSPVETYQESEAPFLASHLYPDPIDLVLMLA